MKHFFKTEKHVKTAGARCRRLASKRPRAEAGFSLLETTAAMVILLIALLGVFSAFTYAVMYNTANTARSKSLAVLQRQAELVRSAKFTPDKTDGEDAGDAVDLTGGEKADQTVTLPDGTVYNVETTVDDDPFTDGVQTDSAKTLKEITITVTPQSSGASWQAAVPSTVIVRRVRSN